MLLHALRRLGLKNTDLARAQCQTIRLKHGAQVRLSLDLHVGSLSLRRGLALSIDRSSALLRTARRRLALFGSGLSSAFRHPEPENAATPACRHRRVRHTCGSSRTDSYCPNPPDRRTGHAGRLPSEYRYAFLARERLWSGDTSCHLEHNEIPLASVSDTTCEGCHSGLSVFAAIARAGDFDQSPCIPPWQQSMWTAGSVNAFRREETSLWSDPVSHSRTSLTLMADQGCPGPGHPVGVSRLPPAGTCRDHHDADSF